jgi:hypothetical protein
MSAAQKFLSGIIAIGMVTTLILPKRQTPAVINATTKFFRGTLATAMGTGKAQ